MSHEVTAAILFVTLVVLGIGARAVWGVISRWYTSGTTAVSSVWCRIRTVFRAICGLIFLAAICYGAVYVYAWWTAPVAIATASHPVPIVSALTGTLSVPPYGKSPRVSIPKGHAATFNSNTAFTTHCIYNDGSEGVVGDPNNPCRDGLIFAYGQDESGTPNTITYVVRKVR